MSRQLALLALVVSDLGCNGRVRIFDWGIDEDDFPASSSGTTSTTAASEGTTEGSAAASTDDTTDGSTDTSTETSAPSTDTGTHTETTADTTDSSSSTSGPPCGNGMCAPDENNNNCPQDCEPICGNTVVEMGEDCDDGNMDDSDDCVAMCKAAECGDTFLQTGVEECDDGNPTDNDGCSSTCKLPRRVVFLTSDTYQGDMDGLMGLGGADAQCMASVTAMTGPGPFRAWLSDSTGNPAMRFNASMTNFAGIYELVNGTSVAEGWAGLQSGNLLHAIDMTESGADMQMTTPWSNTQKGGTKFSESHCNNWKSKMNVDNGYVGNADVAVLNEQWTKFGESFCSTPLPLYCVEDHP
jgi:cysteine-rich repeat protein